MKSFSVIVKNGQKIRECYNVVGLLLLESFCNYGYILTWIFGMFSLWLDDLEGLCC